METEELFTKICRAAADAVWRYVDVSGEDPGNDMPESFVSGFVFDHLGSTTTCMTLETNIRKLFEWNRDQESRAAKALGEVMTQVTLEKVLESLNRRPRVDLVVFERSGAPREAKFVALIEFKRHGLDLWDREKLLAVLAHIDNCPWGAICSVVNSKSDSEWLKRERRAADEAGDCWICIDVTELPHDVEGSFRVCLRAFKRRSA